MGLPAALSRRWLGPILLALLVVIAGCQAVVRLAPGMMPTRIEPGAGPERVSGSDAPVQASGVLELIVKWPTRDLRGFRAALIPLSTNALGITITTSGGAVLAQRVAPRPTGEATTSVKIRLDTASNLGVKVEAFRESSPDLATAQPIARGTAAGVSILPSAVTTVPISLTALFLPTITGLSANAGLEGDTVTISGDNLGMVDGATPSVILEGTAASVSALVVPISSTSLRFTVPTDAAVGRVVVKSDGVPSESSAIFWVLSGLSIDAPQASWDPSPAGSRMAYYGSTLQFTATPIWQLPAGAQASTFGTPPVQTWSSTNVAGNDNTISSGGLLQVGGDNARPADVAVAIGSAKSAVVRVTPVGVDAVQVTPSSVTLNAAPVSGNPAPGFVVTALLTASVSSTLPYAEKLTWETSDATRATVNASGSVTTVANAAPGSVVISVRAVDDQTKRASASVVVTRRGHMQLVID